jgi:phosphoesterase RecJ-like protein
MPHIKQLLADISSYQTFALFGHQSPDGDAIGSILALRKILLDQGKTVSCYTPDPPSKIFSFLPDTVYIRSDFDYAPYDCMIFLDCATYDRIASFTQGHETYFDQAYKIVIDHHITTNPCGQLNIIDETASSNCERIYENLHPYYQIDRQTATYLYMGLMTDTGNFSHEQNTIRTLDNALQLVHAWADKQSLVYHLRQSKTYGQISFVSVVIGRLMLVWKLAWSRYGRDDLDRYQIDEEEADFWLSMIQLLGGVAVTVLFKQKTQVLKVSMRSKMVDHRPAPDVSTIARHFGGGGHRQASGFQVNLTDDVDWQMNHIIQKIAFMLQ